jgi:hypothetical protein
LREVWAYKEPYTFLLFDRDAKFGADVVSAVKDMVASQLARPFAVRGRTVLLNARLGSCQRDLLDHVIILNDRHLKRLMSSYLRIGLVSDSQRTCQQVALQKVALRLNTRFNPFRHPAACTIVMRWQRKLKSYSSEDQTLFLVTAVGITSSANIFRRSTNQPAIPN